MELVNFWILVMPNFIHYILSKALQAHLAGPDQLQRHTTGISKTCCLLPPFQSTAQAIPGLSHGRPSLARYFPGGNHICRGNRCGISMFLNHITRIFTNDKVSTMWGQKFLLEMNHKDECYSYFRNGNQGRCVY